MPHALELVSWNLTARCPLACGYCYLDAGAGDSQELSAAEARHLVREIARVGPGALLVLTGGEPLLRPDLCDLVRLARAEGLLPVVGSSGYGMEVRHVQELRRAGAAGIGLSLDAADPALHDAVRGRRGSWAAVMAAARACREEGLPFHLQVTLGEYNAGQYEALLAMGHELGAVAVNLFFLVNTGRAAGMAPILGERLRAILTDLVARDGRYHGMMIRARCAPHVRAMAQQIPGGSRLLQEDASRCLAARTYCRITPRGDVTPCPYLPEPAGNVRSEGLARIWRESPLFRDLREQALGGRCGECEYQLLCRGCRARAWAAGDALGEDPLCDYTPGAGVVVPEAAPGDGAVRWAPEAEARLTRVPVVLRRMVRRRVEEHARQHGIAVITPELMQSLRSGVRIPQ